MKFTKDGIVEDLINYVMGSPCPTLDGVMDYFDLRGLDSNLVRCELIQFLDEWNNATCDSGGPTKEQSVKLDAILDKYAERILKLCQSAE